MVPVYHCETLSQSTSTPTYSSISVVLFKRALSANLLRDESFYFFLLAFWFERGTSRKSSFTWQIFAFSLHFKENTPPSMYLTFDMLLESKVQSKNFWDMQLVKEIWWFPHAMPNATNYSKISHTIYFSSQLQRLLTYLLNLLTNIEHVYDLRLTLRETANGIMQFTYTSYKCVRLTYIYVCASV